MLGHARRLRVAVEAGRVSGEVAFEPLGTDRRDEPDRRKRPRPPHGGGWARNHRLVVRALVPAVIVGIASKAAAQASGAVQFRVDNDGFDFWRRPWDRPDGEYTNGVRVAVEAGRAPLWRWLAPKSPPCADVPESAVRCSSSVVTVGQDMYTPAEDSQPFTYSGWRDQRPYAGWLYGNMTMRSVRRSTMRSLGLTLGVTGPPSLADQAQRRAHEMMWRYTELPVGWKTQIRFEPGIIVSAKQQWLLFSGSIKGVRLIDAMVNAGASLGNIVTSAEAGAKLRAGINLSHPWRRTRRRGPAEIVGVVGVRGQAVARSIFLDGNTIDPDRRVTRVPGVGDVYGSVGMRLGPIVFAYSVTERSREYTTGPRSHTFGSLVFGIGGTPDVTQY
jgi:lipid A 3-O-deacylase